MFFFKKKYLLDTSKRLDLLCKVPKYFFSWKSVNRLKSSISEERRNKFFPYALLFLVIVILLLAPHLFIIYLQRSHNLNIVYTPSFLNEHWSRYDDLVKLYPSWQLGLRGHLTGMLGVDYGSKTIFPNVLQESLPSLLLAVPVALFQSPDAAFYAAPLFTGLSAVLLAFWIARSFPQIGNGTLFPIFVSLLVITSYPYFRPDLLPLLNVPFAEFQRTLLHDVLKNPYEYNSFYRAHTLGASYFIFLSFLLWLSTVIDTKRSDWRMAAYGIALVGAQFYTYFFYSVATGFCLLGTLTYFMLNRSNENHIRNSLMIITVGIGGLLIAAPSIWNTVSLVFMHENADWILRIRGIAPAAWFSANLEVAIMMLLSLLIMPAISGKVIVSSLTLCVLIFENLHKLIGINIQPGHVYSRAVLPILVAALFIMLYRAWVWFPANRIRVLRVVVRLTSMAVVLYFTGMAALFAYGYALNNYKTQGVTPSERGVIEFLSKKKTTVVGTLFPAMNEAVAVHTNQFVFMPASQHQSNFMTNKLMIERLSILLWLADANEQKITAFLKPTKDITGFDMRNDYYYLQRTYYPAGPVYIGELQKALIRNVDYYRRASKALHVLPSVAEEKYLLPEYLILGGRGDAMASLSYSSNPLLKEVYKNQDYRIYTVKRVEFQNN